MYKYVHQETVTALFIMTPNWILTECLSIAECIGSNNGILCSNENEWSTITFDNLNESHKHYNEWKKPETKEYILYVSLIKSLKTGKMKLLW